MALDIINNHKGKTMKATYAISGEKLLQTHFAPKRFFLDPLLFDGSLTMIFAHPGIGKTWFTLWLASALAAGGDFLKWKCPNPTKVFYIDSEMGLRAIRDRFLQIVKFANFEIQQGMIKFLSPDSLPDMCVPNISTPEGQRIYENEFGDSEVIVIDNLGSAGAPTGRDNEDQAWAKINPWLIKLRQMGKAVIIVHHAGKSGQQLGSSKKEQPLDLLIKLSRPFDYSAKDGVRFEIKFDKARSLTGDAPESISAQLNDYGDSMSWHWETLKLFRRARVAKMLSLKMTPTEMTSALGISFYELRTIMKMIEMGEGFGGEQ